MGSVDVTGIGGLRSLWRYDGHLLHAVGLLFALLAAYAVAQAVYRVWFHPLSRFPGPAHMALSSFPVLFSNHVRGTWVRRVAALHRRYGPAVRIGPNHVALDGSVGWADVYGHRGGGRAEFQKPPPLFDDGGHEALIAAGRDVHRRQRRQLAHAFSDSALAQQEPVVTRYVDMLLGRLAERARAGEEVNIVSWFNFTTFDIIGDLAFSEPFFCLENNGYHPWVLAIFRSIQGISLRRFFQSYPALGWVFYRLGLSATMRSTAAVRSSAKDKAVARMGRGAVPPGGHPDFMTYMMRKTRDGADGMTEGEMLANAPTIVIAGSETTATALSGFCFYLGRSPQAYAALAAEIRSAFRTEADIDLRSTASLEYLQATINEVLRVYPPAAETSNRISPGDVVDGVYVPAGCRLSVYQWATFRNPDNFLEPDSFIPERWLPASHPRHDERFSADRRAVFKPFSFGPRDCIGKNLAYTEMRLIISRFMHRFDFELAPGQDDWHDSQRIFGLWEKGPLNVRLHLRDQDA